MHPQRTCLALIVAAIAVLGLVGGCRTSGSGSSIKEEATPGAAARARFEAQMRALESVLGKNGTDLETADGLVAVEPRQALASFAGLCSLYAGFDPTFERTRIAVENLSVLAELYAKAEGNYKGVARLDLVAKLKEDGWVTPSQTPRLVQFKSFLKTYPFKAYENERPVVLGRLADQLAKVRGQSPRLGDAAGVRASFADWKRVTGAVRGLNGLIAFKKGGKNCEARGEASLKVGDREYAPCRVEKCAFVAMVDATDELGEVAASHGPLSAARKKKAESAAKTLSDGDVTGKMLDQIRKCVR